MSNVTVVIGAGLIGQAIARRVSAGRRVVLADLRLDNAERAASLLADAGFETAAIAVDVAAGLIFPQMRPACCAESRASASVAIAAAFARADVPAAGLSVRVWSIFVGRS